MTLIDHPQLGAEDLLGRRYAVGETGSVPSDPLPDEAWTEVIRRQLAHRSLREFNDRPVDDDVLTTSFAAALSVSWISRVLSRLANAGSLKGRERLREPFVRRGLPMR